MSYLLTVIRSKKPGFVAYLCKQSIDNSYTIKIHVYPYDHIFDIIHVVTTKRQQNKFKAARRLIVIFREETKQTLEKEILSKINNGYKLYYLKTKLKINIKTKMEVEKGEQG